MKTSTANKYEYMYNPMGCYKDDPWVEKPGVCLKRDGGSISSNDYKDVGSFTTV